MQNQPLKAFDFQGSQVRTITKDGEPWFCAADVCRALDILNTTDAIGRLDEDERTLVSNEGREINFVSESGVYSLVLGSRKPEAKAFKRWITHEVLPTIRKTGRYEVVDRLTRKDLAMLLLEAELEAETTRAALAAAAPLVAYAEKVQGSPSLVTVDECAKVLGLPVIAFRTFVREKYLFRRHGEWWPREEYGENGRGLFQMTSGTWAARTGENIAFHTCKVTGLGKVKLKEAWDRAHALEAAQ